MAEQFAWSPTGMFPVEAPGHYVRAHDYDALEAEVLRLRGTVTFLEKALGCTEEFRRIADEASKRVFEGDLKEAFADFVMNCPLGESSDHQSLEQS